jgi:hypothetical protein
MPVHDVSNEIGLIRALLRSKNQVPLAEVANNVMILRLK